MRVTRANEAEIRQSVINAWQDWSRENNIAEARELDAARFHEYLYPNRHHLLPAVPAGYIENWHSILRILNDAGYIKG